MGERLWLTGQLELLLLDHGLLVREEARERLLQVRRAARFGLGRGQHICDCLLFPLANGEKKKKKRSCFW